MNDYFSGLGEIRPDLEPEDSDIFLSQTTVNNAQLCGGKVLYKDHPDYNHVPSEAMSFGTMVHGGIELDLQSLLAGDADVGEWSADGIEALWVDGLLNERDGSFDLYELASRSRIDTSVAEALVAVRTFATDVLPKLDLSDDLLIEQRVTKQLGTLPDGRAVWFGGTADLVDVGRGTTYDWKTSGKAWDESKAHAGNQASYYTWLYGPAQHEYHVFSRKDQAWQKVETYREQEHVDAVLRLAWQVAKQMADGSLSVNPWASNWGKYKRAWYCSAKWCAAWDACEMKSINDNVWEGEKINIAVGWE